jgi:hypothetical protein
MDYDIEKEVGWLNDFEVPQFRAVPPSDSVLVRGATVEILGPHEFVMRTHVQDECAGRPCVIHAPTAHSMRSMPLIWRWDRGIFERRCSHGIGHPDPDQMDYWRETGGEQRVEDEMIHGCDGCCGPE